MNFRKIIFFLSATLPCTIYSSAQQNLSLVAHVPNSPGVTLAGVWQYVDSTGKEYALVGASSGTDIYDLSVPSSPNLVLSVPGLNSNWREIKTWGKYAYVTTEAVDTINDLNNGLQIINLSFLPDSAPSKIWKGDGAINNQLQRGHTVTAEGGYVFINGGNLAGGGVVIADLADPWNPHYVGQYSAHYVHDSYVRGDRLWTSEVTPGQFSILDITSHSNPVLLNSVPALGVICHNGWLSDNGNHYFAAVEVPGAPLAAYDVTNLTNITAVDVYFATDSPAWEVHNVRVLNDYLINACYGSQVTIVDAARPHNLIQVGNYFTGGGLCWDASPLLPSGNILATDKNGGFYVLAPTYIRACYLEGIVKDSSTGGPVNSAHVQIITTPVLDSTNFAGQYATGILQAGVYDVQFSAQGYLTKTFNGITLNNGVLTTLNAELVPDLFSVNEISGVNSFSIFPNPVVNELKINNVELRIEKIEIYNAFGQKVFDEQQTASRREKIIELGSLPPGVYLLTITNPEHRKLARKFVKY